MDQLEPVLNGLGPDRLQSLVAPFVGQKPDRTGPV
jgi:hypothetical protein